MANPNARSARAGIIQDCAGFGGAGLITYGVGSVYHPAGFIVGGLFLLAGSWLAARAATD